MVVMVKTHGTHLLHEASLYSQLCSHLSHCTSLYWSPLVQLAISFWIGCIACVFMAIYSVCRFYEGWSWQFHPKAFSNLHHPPLGLFDLPKTTCCPIFWNLGFQSFFVFPNLYFIKKKITAITIKDKRFVWSSIHKILNNRKEQELLKDNGGVDDDSVSASIEWAAWGTTCILPTCILPAKPLFTITLLSHISS